MKLVFWQKCKQRNISRNIWRRRQWHPPPALLPGKSHGWRSLVGCSPWGRKESDMTEWLPFQFSLSCIGEGNANLLQCSCQENPRNGGAWWAAVYGVAQSRTWLKRLSSSSSSRTYGKHTAMICLGKYYRGLSRSFIYYSKETLQDKKNEMTAKIVYNIPIHFPLFFS